MPSLRARIKHLAYEGIISEKDKDRIISALDVAEGKTDVIDKLRAEIMDFEEDIFHSTKDYSDYAAVRHCVDIIDKYRQED